MNFQRLCMVTRIPGIAGPANFQRRLERGLSERGIQISYSLDDRPYDVVLVIGATRNLLDLQRVRREGIPVVQRLNGMNWIHRQVHTGWRHSLRAEINNFLLRFIRSKVADHVIYQSQFARLWWERVNGETAVDSDVVYNGVPLDDFSPEGEGEPPSDRTVVLMVEANLSGGYEVGLEVGVELVRKLQEHRSEKILLQVAGNVSEGIRSRWDSHNSQYIQWLGLIATGDIPKYERGAHMLFSGDPNPACPNAVIEALACGLPVVAFDTGALPEMVTGDAGMLAGYGGDPWRLDAPDMEALLKAASQVLAHQSRFRAGARASSGTIQSRYNGGWILAGIPEIDINP